MDNGIIFRQSRMGMNTFMGVILFLTIVQWMMLDMYLPALPVLKEEFGVSESALNVSLNAGIIASAIGMLIGGTLSDKYGRKGLLMISLAITGTASMSASLAGGVAFISIARGISGLTSGFILAITSAVIRDSFDGQRFQKMLSLQQAIAIVGPLLSPAAGSFTIQFLSWRWIFIFLGLATLAGIIPLYFVDETWPKERRTVTGTSEMVGGIKLMLKEKPFIAFMAVMLVISIPLWAYLSVSSYIFYGFFNVSNIEFSILYACTSGMSLVGTFIFMWTSARIEKGNVLWICAAMLFVSCALLALFGMKAPVIFVLCLVALVLAEGIVRPLGMVVVLDTHQESAGTASALSNFMLNIVAIAGTSIATLGWSSFITGLSVISGGCGVLSVGCIIILIRKKYYNEELFHSVKL